MKHFFAGSLKWVPYDHASDAHCITTFNIKHLTVCIILKMFLFEVWFQLKSSI